MRFRVDIINNIVKEGRYSYTVLVKSPDVPIGFVSGTTVTPFTTFNIGPFCDEFGNNLSVLPDSPIANTTYLNGPSYVVRGGYGVGAGNDAPGAGEEPSFNGACPASPVDDEPVPVPVPVVPSDQIVDDFTNPGTLTGVTIQEDVTITNEGTIEDVTNSGTIQGGTVGGTTQNKGVIANATNTGTIQGGTLAGTTQNKGTINNVTLVSNASIDGGKISGTLAGGPGTNSTVKNALIDATSISNVKIGFGCKVTQNTVKNVPGQDLTGAITKPDGVVDTGNPLLVDAAGNELTLGDLLKNQAKTTLGDNQADIESDPVTGTAKISSKAFNDVIVPVKALSVFTTTEPDGVSATSSGEIVIINSGIATTLAPSSPDLQAFNSALSGGGITSDVKNNGVVTVELPDGLRLSLRFDSFAVMTASIQALSGNGFAAAPPVFTFKGDPDDLESFHILAIYSDGLTQKMPPFVHDLDKFKEFMKTFNLTYQIIPSTGVIEVYDAAGTLFYRGIADYTLTDPPAGATGITFEDAGDINGDGLDDLYMITETAKQIIYTLPLQ